MISELAPKFGAATHSWRNRACVFIRNSQWRRQDAAKGDIREGSHVTHYLASTRCRGDPRRDPIEWSRRSQPRSLQRRSTHGWWRHPSHPSRSLHPSGRLRPAWTLCSLPAPAVLRCRLLRHAVLALGTDSVRFSSRVGLRSLLPILLNSRDASRADDDVIRSARYGSQSPPLAGLFFSRNATPKGANRSLTRDRPRLAGQLEDVQAGIETIGRIDVAAIVDFHVVGHDEVSAALLLADLDATLVGRLGDGGHEKGDLLRLVRIAHVDHPDAGGEEADENELLVKDRVRGLVGGVRAEAAEPGAKTPAGFAHRPIRHDHGLRFDGDVREKDHLP